MPGEMLEHALAYAERGWPVFPCHPETKRPLLGNDLDETGKPVPNTGGLKKASTDETLVRQWWGKWPLAMIGVPTGLKAGVVDGQNGCGLFVIDLDVPDGIDPDDCAAGLLETIPPLPDTGSSRTGSGGLHFWFLMPEGKDGRLLGNRAALLDKKNRPDHASIWGDVDVRGNGGYVIVPPSVRADGAFYEWQTDQEFATATPALLDYVIKRRGEAPPAPRPAPVREPSSTPWNENDAIRRYCLAALDREIGDLQRTGEGGRNHALNGAAFSLGSLIGAGGLSESEVISALRGAADANGLAKDDGWPSVEKTIYSGLEGGKRKPRDLRDVSAASRAAPRPSDAGPAATRRTTGGAQSRPDSDNPNGIARETGHGGVNRPSTPGGIAERAQRAAGLVPPERDVPGDAGQDVPKEADFQPEPDISSPLDRPDGFSRTNYSTPAMNRDWALVLMGAKAAVIHEQPDGPIEDRLRVLSLEAFNAWFSNRFVERRQPDGKTKAVTWAKAWMNSAKRRQYKGLVFQPDPGCVAVRQAEPARPHPLAHCGFRPHFSLTPQKPDADLAYLNLWRGFDIVPDPAAGDYGTFKDHLLTNVCGGDMGRFKWIFGSFAHMLQKPRERPGTAMVFRGRMGSGKSTVGEVIGSLIPAHYFQVDDPRYITGQFNAHMASCLLLQAEEAVWAGDKAAEGRLKGLITSKFQMIEAKGIDPIRVDNFVRLIMTSNEEWVVPAGKDERRFAVFDVADNAAQNHGYFRELHAELDAGGRAALLHDLLTFDLASVDLWTIPKTNALLEQKIRSLDSVESWWFERLWSGDITRKAGGWEREISKRAVFEDYIDQADQVGVRRKSEEVVFGVKLKRLVPGLGQRRPLVTDDLGGTKRTWCYIVPSLDDCRAAFEGLVGQVIDWPKEDDAREAA